MDTHVTQHVWDNWFSNQQQVYSNTIQVLLHLISLANVLYGQLII